MNSIHLVEPRKEILDGFGSVCFGGLPDVFVLDCPTAAEAGSVTKKGHNSNQSEKTTQSRDHIIKSQNLTIKPRELKTNRTRGKCGAAPKNAKAYMSRAGLRCMQRSTGSSRFITFVTS